MGETTGTKSPIELKANLGRGVLRPKNHQGQHGNPTLAAVLSRDTGRDKGPTKLEIDILFRDNPTTVSAYRKAGLTDDQIYEILNT